MSGKNTVTSCNRFHFSRFAFWHPWQCGCSRAARHEAAPHHRQRRNDHFRAEAVLLAALLPRRRGQRARRGRGARRPHALRLGHRRPLAHRGWQHGGAGAPPLPPRALAGDAGHRAHRVRHAGRRARGHAPRCARRAGKTAAAARARAGRRRASRSAAMKRVLDRLREPGAIRVEFQPIVKVRPDHVELYAVEALARGPRGTSVERPEVLFEYARRKGVESDIDLICITEAFEAYSLLPTRPLLSINVHGATLASVDHFSDRILSAAKAYGVAHDNLMFEVLEYRAPWAIETFLTTLDLLRDAGVRIAVDDLGVGASNYQMIVECRPDCLKIDRHIVD